MNIALYPADTIGRSLAITLFNHHRRTDPTSTSAQLVSIPGFLHELGVGTVNNPDEPATKPVLDYLAALASEASRLPWDGLIGAHIASANSLSVAARLAAILLPQIRTPGLSLGTVPADAGDDPAELLGLMHDFARQLDHTAQHLNVQIGDAAEWMDPHALACDVADIHDLARGYLAAARTLSNLGFDTAAR